MFDNDFVTRFEAKLDKSGDCWLWTASLAGKGYGQMKLPKQRKQEYAHRLAYMIYKGAIPDGIQVCHKCDNPRCCNPEHIFLGTSSDNHLDMKEKNRHLYGEKNSQAKLSDTKISQIKKCIDSGMSQSIIAKAFGIHQTTVSKINRGCRWQHIK